MARGPGPIRSGSLALGPQAVTSSPGAADTEGGVQGRMHTVHPRAAGALVGAIDDVLERDRSVCLAQEMAPERFAENVICRPPGRSEVGAGGILLVASIVNHSPSCRSFWHVRIAALDAILDMPADGVGVRSRAGNAARRRRLPPARNSGMVMRGCVTADAREPSRTASGLRQTCGAARGKIAAVAGEPGAMIPTAVAEDPQSQRTTNLGAARGKIAAVAGEPGAIAPANILSLRMASAFEGPC